jgi:hypothetical protein
METKPKPLPCPFCGNTNVKVHYNDTGVSCNCGAWMPSRISSDPARCQRGVEAWNRRVECIIKLT